MCVGTEMEIYCRRLLKVIVVWRLYIQLLLNDLRNLTPMAEEQEAKQSKKNKNKNLAKSRWRLASVAEDIE